MQPGVQYKEPKKELSSAAQETLKAIRSVLEERYVVEDKLLNLSALGLDKKLLDMGFFEGPKASSPKFFYYMLTVTDTDTVGKLFPVMMVVCSDIFTEPEKKVEFVPSISLAKNNISNGIAQVPNLVAIY